MPTNHILFGNWFNLPGPQFPLGKMGGTWLNNDIGIYYRNLFSSLALTSYWENHSSIAITTKHQLRLCTNFRCTPTYTQSVTHTVLVCCLCLLLGCGPVKCYAHAAIRETRLESQIKPLSSRGALSKSQLQWTSISMLSFCVSLFQMSPHAENTYVLQN